MMKFLPPAMRLQWDPEKRVFGLDLLRAIAILLVMRVHINDEFVHWNTPHTYYLNRLLSYLDGVDIFFVLSGFLIGGILIRSFEHTHVQLSGIRRFWKFRWFRTLPNYYLVMAMILVLLWVTRHDLMGFNLSYLFFLQNLDWRIHPFMVVSWSLAVEEWFYLVFPLILWGVSIAGPRISFRIRFLSCILLFMLVPVAFRLGDVWPYLLKRDLHGYFDRNAFSLNWDIRTIAVCRLDAIAFGILGAWAAHFYPLAWKRFRLPALLAGMLLVFHLTHIMPNGFSKVVFFRYELLMGVLFILPSISHWTSAPSWLLRPVTYISLVSYSLYLVHFHIVLLLIEVGTGLRVVTDGATSIWIYALYISGSFILSLLLYKYVEKPMLDMRERSFRFPSVKTLFRRH